MIAWAGLTVIAIACSVDLSENLEQAVNKLFSFYTQLWKKCVVHTKLDTCINTCTFIK